MNNKDKKYKAIIKGNKAKITQIYVKENKEFLFMVNVTRLNENSIYDSDIKKVIAKKIKALWFIDLYAFDFVARGNGDLSCSFTIRENYTKVTE